MRGPARNTPRAVRHSGSMQERPLPQPWKCLHHCPPSSSCSTIPEQMPSMCLMNEAPCLLPPWIPIGLEAPPAPSQVQPQHKPAPLKRTQWRMVPTLPHPCGPSTAHCSNLGTRSRTKNMQMRTKAACPRPQGQVQGWEPMPVRTPGCKQQR